MPPTDARPTIPPLRACVISRRLSGRGCRWRSAWRGTSGITTSSTRLFELLTARIKRPSRSTNSKTAFSHHAYLCAEHVTALRTRVSEMRDRRRPGRDSAPRAATALR